MGPSVLLDLQVGINADEGETANQILAKLPPLDQQSILLSHLADAGDTFTLFLNEIGSLQYSLKALSLSAGEGPAEGPDESRNVDV